MKITEIRKLLIAVATLAGSLLAQGLLPEDWAPYVAAGLAALGTLGIYAVPNAPADPAPEGLFVTVSGSKRVDRLPDALAEHFATVVSDVPNAEAADIARAESLGWSGKLPIFDPTVEREAPPDPDATQLLPKITE